METDRHEEIARGLFRESNDALFLFDPADNRVVDLNPAALRLTGFERKDAVGLRVWELFSSAESEGIGSLIQAYSKTGFFHSREGYFLARAEGGPIPVNLSVSRIHTKPTPLGLATARDVREPRRAQETLDRFFRLSPALFAIFERSGKALHFRKFNDAWTRTLGHAPETLGALDFGDLVHPDDLEATRQAIGSLGHGEVSGFEHRLRRLDGDVCWVAWNAVEVDRLVYAVGRETTAERRAKALQLAKEAAEAASRGKSEFLAHVSHELRTPLTTILGCTEALEHDTAFRDQASPDRLDDLAAIRRSGEHLLALIEDILDLSLIESGGLRIEPAPHSPARLAAEVVASLRPQAEAKGLNLAVEVPGPIPAAVRIDAVRLRQVLLNLATNAIKFTAQGGVRVVVDLERRPGGGASIRFAVIDTGIGMSADEISGLFRPFFRGEFSRRVGVPGAGLGLAFSRRLVEFLGGRLDVESRPGEGSRFTVTLPVGEPEASSLIDPREAIAPAPAGPPKSPATKALLGRRILLAEDNAANLRIISLHLNRLGAEVVAVPDGQAAVDAVLSARDAGSPLDVVLMDMEMPVLDGYEATRQLRSQGVRTPILALTAYAMPEDREQCLRFGCDEHLSKPIDWARLVELIDRYAGPRGE